MNLTNQVFTKGMTLGKNTIVFVLLIFFIMSCYEPAGPACESNKDGFIITVDEDGTGGTQPVSVGPCDIFFNKSFAGDSLTLSGIAGFTRGSTPYLWRITLLLINLKSTGEYAFGIESVPGEPSVICEYSYGEFLQSSTVFYSTAHEGGSGMLTIDNLSSDYISGTFHATLFNFDSTPFEMAEITSGSFLISL